MTGPEHYREAEKLLDHLDVIPDPHGDASHAVDLITAEAQVHATLALAAATADGPAVMRPEDRDEWDRATGRLEAKSVTEIPLDVVT